MKFTQDQIGVFAVNAGFTDWELEVAKAIAMAESGGDPDAYNPETQAGAPAGEGSYGLWQIYRNAHPAFKNWNLKDPQVCACAAFMVYHDDNQDFDAWSTFKSGAYLKFLPHGSSPEDPSQTL
jgi:hypothetical protein